MFRLISFITLISSLFLSQQAFATDKPILTVYSYDSFMSQWGPGEEIKKDFEAICDCQLNVVSIGDGVTLLNRLKLEGKRSKADVVLGLDTNLIAQAKKAGVVQSHQIEKPQKPALDWWDSDFVPYDYGYFAFIYNQEKIKIPPHNFSQLLDEKQKWKIVYQDPRTSTPGLGLLLWINKTYGDEAADIWKKLSSKTLTVTKGWSESYKLFTKGEADFVLSYSTSPVVHILNDEDHRYKAAIFDEGHYQQIEVVAITQQTKQFELAQKFVAFLLTPKIQQLFAEKNIMFPVMNVDLPAAYSEINQVKKPLTFTPDEVMKNQTKWINLWRNTVIQ